MLLKHKLVLNLRIEGIEGLPKHHHFMLNHQHNIFI